MRFRLLLATVALLSASVAAHADNITFDLLNLKLSDGGTLTGSFTTDSTFTHLVSEDIVASAHGNFAGATYTTDNSFVTAEILPNFFQLDSIVPGNELRLLFAPKLNGDGGNLMVSSYEFELSGGSRFVSSGSVARHDSLSNANSSGAGSAGLTAVAPEPSSLILLGTGLFGVVAVARRRLIA